MSIKLPGGDEWTFSDIELYANAIEEVATEKLRLQTYPNQIEIITAEQMIDAYASVGLPVSYSHWSYGKEFIRNMQQYKRGHMGLAYEIVINSDPCIAYLMEENSLPMQALVIAHACHGHNAFFKNNYLFQERTHADSIIDYLVFAQRYVKEQEEIHGIDVVEEFLDHCHAISDYGFDHYPRKAELSKRKQEQILKTRIEEDRKAVNEFWSTVVPKSISSNDPADKFKFPKDPQENLLYFLEKYAPNLEEWQREIIRIVRKLQEYFYPQRQTQVGNEGFATFTHYEIITELDKQGRVDENFMMSLLKSHTNVVAQPSYNSKYYSGINVYALGYNMFKDIKRMCQEPTKEDELWFPDVVGRDYVEVTQEAAYMHRDETFIEQYLSPKVMRDMGMFAHCNDAELPFSEITAIHNDIGYKNVRKMMAHQKNIFNIMPQIEITDVDVRGDRTLTLQHTIKNGTLLDEKSVHATLHHIAAIWDFDVILESVDPSGDIVEIWSNNEDKQH